MLRFRRAAVAIVLVPVLALAAQLAAAQDIAPDVLVKSISEEVVAAITRDKEAMIGNKEAVSSLVEAKILPHFNFARMTQIALAVNWRRAAPEQQARLTSEFRALLVNTYSGALTAYRNQPILVRPLRAQPGDTEVTVRSEIRQSGAAPISIDYLMEKGPSGWKVYDVKISGISLTTTYRDTFAEEVRNHGLDGLIRLLESKNRQNDAKRISVKAQDGKAG